MAYNKFIKKDGTVFLDLTADTVTEADVASGKTFHKADGTLAIGTASGGTTEKDIFPTETIDFQAHPTFTPLYYGYLGNLFSLIAGETYYVVWDGTAYECVAREATLPTTGETGIAMGNLSLAGIGEDTGEPFAIAYDLANNSNFAFTLSTDSTHTIRIYQKVSGGGSSLPAGVYWERVYDYTNVFSLFLYKGEIHMLQRVSDTACNIAKYTANGLVTVVSNLPMENFARYPRVNGDVVHFLNADDWDKWHYIWDGTTFTKLADFSISPDTAFIWNGELYLAENGYCYKWDSATDTVSTTADATVKVKDGATQTRVCVCNNEVYSMYLKTLYKNNNGTLETITALSTAYDVLMAEDDDNLLLVLTGSNKIARYNISSKTETVIAEVGPTFSDVYQKAYLLNGKLHLVGQSQKDTHYIMHEIK